MASQQRPRRKLLHVLLVGALIAVLLLVASSAGFPSSHWAVQGFYRDLLGLSAGDADAAAAITRKGFHIPAYALLAVLCWWALPPGGRKAWLVLLVVLTVAGADEWLQSFQPGRSGSVRDVFVDLFGALLGLALVRWWGRRRARRAVRGGAQDGA